ncbi:Oxysterol-binding protein 2 [Bagarius yarrelli]|uniref:Oxysterol-binding protein n=1 Tax=Bagarius yarrelli TaxID=175774 RepID=A0A556VUD3_BAGYA|nr:Oxysterol-binding protein 2 [Bagarius yarrelli]
MVLSSGGRSYHLKAATEVERQKWVTALELAKAKAVRMMNDQSGVSERTRKEEASDEDEDTEFFDAMEDSPAFITVTAADVSQHRRSQSNLSGASGGQPSDWTLEHHVNFNEPLSMLQRLSEDLEYSELLDKAARCENSLEQMCLVAAFSVSSYSTTVHRTAKPFNPLLGETYELDRLDDYGYRSICEQVSHHPPAAAHHVISQRGWTLWQEITIASKFRGKYLSIMPLGAIHLQFHSSGNHYVWRKVTSTVHNIIVGKLWIDQSGDIDIVNHRTKETCQLKFSPYSYFSREVPRKVLFLQNPTSQHLTLSIYTPTTSHSPSTPRPPHTLHLHPDHLTLSIYSQTTSHSPSTPRPPHTLHLHPDHLTPYIYILTTSHSPSTPRPPHTLHLHPDHLTLSIYTGHLTPYI